MFHYTLISLIFALSVGYIAKGISDLIYGDQSVTFILVYATVGIVTANILAGFKLIQAICLWFLNHWEKPDEKSVHLDDI